MDGFESTLPFARDSPDKIVRLLVAVFAWTDTSLQHFKDTPAQEAWLLQLTHKLDLCGQSS
jgi:hypothetical protein